MEEGEEVQRIRCFFDISIGGLHSGRLLLELFNEFVPKTCENFKSLCTGEAGVGATTHKPLHYKDVLFHRVVKDFMIQGGDFSNGNGTGGESIFGGTFEDENFHFKHEKPFLLSMANRGKDTNGSQFFITTQPAPHLDNVHVVFGHVVGGIDLVRQIEALPVDANSRPLQDVKITKCGELVKQVKVKKDKKKKDKDKEKEIAEEGEDKKSKKKHKRDKKKERKDKNKENGDDKSDGQLSEEEDKVEEDDVHPLVTLSNINPDEIPDVPTNKFLLRGGQTNVDKNGKDKHKDRSEREWDRKADYRDRQDGRNGNFRGGRQWGNNRTFNRRGPATTKSGRIIKGRGKFRFRTPSRSRSRSTTPIHWKQAEKRVIKLAEFEKHEADRKHRDSLNSARENEEEIRRGSEKQKNTSFTPEKRSSNKKVDYNALDYEDHSEDDNDVPKRQVASLVQYPLNSTLAKNKENVPNERETEELTVNARSEFLAMALGVQIKDKDDQEFSSEKVAKQVQPPARPPKHQQAGREDQNKQFLVQSRLMKMAGLPEDQVRLRRNTETSNDDGQQRRNKFEIEKPGKDGRSFGGKNEQDRRRGGPDYKKDRPLSRPHPHETDRHRNLNQRDQHHRDKDRKSRRSRSPARRSSSRSRDKQRKKSKSRTPEKSRRRSRSHGRVHKRTPSRDRKRLASRERDDRKSRDEKARREKEEQSKEHAKKVDDTEEKVRKLLLIREKVKLLEEKRKAEELKKLQEERQRKAKEEAEMLEKAKRAKRKALEKEKLLKTYKVLQELDKRVGGSGKSRRRSSSSSSSSDSSPRPRKGRRSRSASKPRGKSSGKQRRRTRSSSSSSSSSDSRRKTPIKKRR